MSPDYEENRAIVEDVDVLTPDFGDAIDFEPVPAGTYTVQVRSVEGPIWPKGFGPDNRMTSFGTEKHPYVRFNLDVVQMPGFENRRLRFQAAYSGEYAGFLLEALRALKPDYQKGDPVPKEELIGTMAQAVVEEDMHEGRKVNNVRRLMPMS